jgi:hypothetical protein
MKVPYFSLLLISLTISVHLCVPFQLRNKVSLYKVVQIWPGLIVCKQVTVCPGHIWTTLYMNDLCRDKITIWWNTKRRRLPESFLYYKPLNVLRSFFWVNKVWDLLYCVVDHWYTEKQTLACEGSVRLSAF